MFNNYYYKYNMEYDKFNNDYDKSNNDYDESNNDHDKSNNDYDDQYSWDTSRTPSMSESSGFPFMPSWLTGYVSPAKPPLVCHLLSPVYATNISDHFFLLSQALPNPGVCDYVVLDLPLLSNGTYPPDSYEFLPNGTGYKFLFTISLVQGDFIATQGILSSQLFKHTVRTIRQHRTLPLYGFGFLRDLPIPSSMALATRTMGPLSGIYQVLSNVLRTEGVRPSDVCNFVAFKPSSLTIRRGVYEGLLSVINHISSISLVFIVTVTEEQTKYVLPSSAWGDACWPMSNEVKMMDAVDLIASVSAPNVIFTLTLSLRIDTFTHVRMSDIGTNDVGLVLSHDHSTGYYDRECEDFFQHDSRGTSPVYFGEGDCMFAPKHGSDSVVSFETPETVRHKVVAAYRHLGYGKTSQYIIGWSVYNVTHGMAPQSCNGTNNRINQIRKVIDDNK
ncbi:uncharacterized protein LOC125941007 [Dermacentor silvarum]|uniref:uncharacterized protein LOC125941007 n=1 Tax=Dermacentor silvarum TaxID=543639 RepID=UPI0021013043|nr:uncharacterized protein LOC125941007 [Dermacentor silvarum]